jgi:hypothetical protein
VVRGMKKLPSARSEKLLRSLFSPSNNACNKAARGST